MSRCSICYSTLESLYFLLACFSVRVLIHVAAYKARGQVFHAPGMGPSTHVFFDEEQTLTSLTVETTVAASVAMKLVATANVDNLYIRRYPFFILRGTAKTATRSDCAEQKGGLGRALKPLSLSVSTRTLPQCQHISVHVSLPSFSSTSSNLVSQTKLRSKYT